MSHRVRVRVAERERRDHQGFAVRRLLVATAVGLVGTGIVVVAGAGWPVAILAGWDTLTLVFLLRVWVTVAGMNERATERHALAEDDSRTAADAVLLGASLVSLVAVVWTLAEAQKSSGIDAVLLVSVALLSIALGWASIHTTYMLRYARLYYTSPIGGIEFESQPDYRDVAYMAFTIGMTYQVSDTGVSRKEIRHAVVMHALLSFVFGTAIIAVAINGVANLING